MVKLPQLLWLFSAMPYLLPPLPEEETKQNMIFLKRDGHTEGHFTLCIIGTSIHVLGTPKQLCNTNFRGHTIDGQPETLPSATRKDSIHFAWTIFCLLKLPSTFSSLRFLFWSHIDPRNMWSMGFHANRRGPSRVAKKRKQASSLLIPSLPI